MCKHENIVNDRCTSCGRHFDPLEVKVANAINNPDDRLRFLNSDVQDEDKDD